jgi:asparagine synthase (glutamine-hydrolysing)
MSTYTPAYKRQIGVFSSDVEKLCANFLLEYFDKVGEKDPIGACGYTDLLTYLPYDILAKVDIASMANSLEVRCPFLDHEFVEMSLSIPSSMKLKGLNTKYILKQAFKGMLPSRIFYRGKMGFGIPLAKWLRTDLKEMVEDLLLSKTARERGFFNYSGVERLCREHLLGKFDHSYRLWLLLWFELWHRIFIDRSLSP